MKKLHIVICTLIAVVLIYSCSSYRNEKTKEVISTRERQAQINSESETEFYVCQGDTIIVESIVGSPKRLLPYKSILQCLNETGRYGDVEANKEIAKIITKTGYHGLRFFDAKFPTNRFRGEEVFESILNLGPNDTRSATYDGDELQSTYTAINTQYLRYMIESIDGETNIAKYVHLQNRDFGKGIVDVEEYIIAKDRTYYNTIKQAWEDGLIVLKPYYNK